MKNKELDPVEIALAYLRSRKATHKLETPCPVLGKDILLYRPASTATR